MGNLDFISKHSMNFVIKVYTTMQFKTYFFLLARAGSLQRERGYAMTRREYVVARG